MGGLKVLRLFTVDPWLVATTRLEHTDRRLQESITAVGNGYMGLRGLLQTGYSGDGLQGTYTPGVWFPDKTRVGWTLLGYPEYFGKDINAPSFLGIGITVNGQQVDLAKSTYRDFYLALDHTQGLYTRRFVYIGAHDTVQLQFARFYSQTIPEAAYITVNASVLKDSATITLHATLDGRDTNTHSN